MSKKSKNKRGEYLKPSKTPLPADSSQSAILDNRNSSKEEIDIGGCRVTRKRVEEVVLYEVKENELDTLEKGKQNDIYLNFAIFCFSIMMSCLAALITSDFKYDFAQTAFFCMVAIGGIIGTILLFLWWRGKDSIKEIVKTIRERSSE
ncbi:hypothetical protein [Bacteroides reticulotermitis]|uniref:hypothetical protein n=1 Tax=Bacteroides reticulotermitis TaxID=1133319 RepID=UPI003A88E2DD